MADDVAAQPKIASPTGTYDHLNWKRVLDNDFGYPIDYSIAPISLDHAKGKAEFIIKWAPEKYCHFHRHTGHTTILVLEGEHHVIEKSSTETVHKTRLPGHLTHNPPGDVHMERAGPQGSVLFFSMETPDGKLFEVLDADGTVVRDLTMKDLETGNY